MQKNLKLFLIVCAVLGLLCLTGCGKYVSSHSAIGFVHTNHAKDADMTFSSFSGSEVFKMQVDGEAGGQIKYSAKLGNGAATVYYDTDGTKKELFSVRAGEDADSAGGELVKGTLYIIVETSEKCENGEFHFSIQ